MRDAAAIHPVGDADHEVVVVGARSAGGATARLLAQQGHDVLVLDRATFPSDTLSTHALSRGGVVQLARWGLLDAVVASGAPPIRTVTFRSGDATRVTTVKASAGVDHLLAPRRHVLDAIVLESAIDMGARVETGVTVTGVLTEAGRVTGVTTRDDAGHSRRVRAGIVVGADGVRSRVARSIGAPVVDDRPSTAATHYAFVAGLDADGFEFHVGEQAFAGVFPTHGGEANVWICHPADDGHAGGRDPLGAFLDRLGRAAPSLARRVARAEVTSVVRGAARLPNHVRRAAGPGWALVGDAGYHRDPITGHGMTDAFRDAELLAFHLGRVLRGEATEAAALATYGAERDRALGPIFDLTCRLAAFPPADEFVALQKELAGRIEDEARWLAGRPPVTTAGLAAA